MPDDAFHVFDTTLRDGAQREGLNLTVADKLAIARQLDDFGVGFIEGGWPGAIPKDTEFFRRAAHRARPQATRSSPRSAPPAGRRGGRRRPAGRRAARVRRAGGHAGRQVPRPACRAGAAHHAGREPAMIRDTVSHLRGEGRRVFVDAEHFFDGYRADPAYALEVVRTAAEAGADVVVLCDTNGGMLPAQIGDVVAAVARRHRRPAGHPLPRRHRLRGRQHPGGRVDAGATHVQGTANGYGERAGNANLFTVVAGLELKQGREVLPDGRLAEMSRVSHAIGEVANVTPSTHQPYVGLSAFAHKAGLHASAVKVDPTLYQHIDPGTGRQRHADARLRHGGPRLHRAQGQAARLRPVRRPGDRRPGRRAGQGAGGQRLHLRGRRRLLRAAAARRAGGRAAAPLRRSSPGASSSSSAPTARWSARPP